MWSLAVGWCTGRYGPGRREGSLVAVELGALVGGGVQGSAPPSAMDVSVTAAAITHGTVERSVGAVELGAPVGGWVQRSAPPSAVV